MKNFFYQLMAATLIGLIIGPPLAHSKTATSSPRSNKRQKFEQLNPLPGPGEQSLAQLTWNSTGKVKGTEVNIQNVQMRVSQIDPYGNPTVATTVRNLDDQNVVEAENVTSGLNERSLTLNVSPRTGPPGTIINVTGKVPDDMNVDSVQISLEYDDYTHGLAEAPVRDGQFNTQITIPEDAQPGRFRIAAIAGNVEEVASSSKNFTLLKGKGSVSGTVSVELSDGTIQPVDGASVVLGFLTNTNPPKVSGMADATNNQGNYAFSNIESKTYMVSVQQAPIIFPTQNVQLKPGQDLVLDIVGKFANTAEEKCFLVDQDFNEDIGSAVQYAQPGKNSGFHFGTFASMPGKGVPFINNFFTGMPFSPGPGESFSLRFYGSGQPTEVPMVLTGSGYFQTWLAEADMSEFPAGNYEIVPTYHFTDDQGTVACEFDPTLAFKMVDVPWFSPNVNNPTVTVIKSKPYRYKFNGTLPKSALNWSEPIDFEFVELDNIVSLGVPVQETLNLDGTWQGTATATAKVVFLELTFLDQSLPYNTSGGAFNGHTYSLPTYHKNLFEACFTIFSYGYGIPSVLYIGISVDFCIGGFIDFNSQIMSDYGLKATVAPGVTLGIPIKAEIDILVCSGEIGVTPQVTVQLPIACEANPQPVCGFQNPCLSIDAIFHYEVECLFWTVAEGSETVNIYETGCNIQNGILSDSPIENVSSPRRINLGKVDPRPTIATDGAGHALAVWLQENSTDASIPDRRLYWSSYDGTAWNAAQPVYPDLFVVNRPQACYLGPDRALAVWEQNRLSFDQGTASDEATIRDNMELFYAVWNGSSWSVASAITNDGISDARPTLSCSNNKAVLGWIHGDPLGQSGVEGIYAATFDGNQWSSAGLVSERDSSADYQPEIRFDQGSKAHMVWLNDGDGNLFTREDRRILKSELEANGWTIPATIPNLPEGSYSPTLTFDQDNNPLVAFVVPPVTNLPETTIGTGDGNKSQLHSAYFKNGSWTINQVSEHTFAELPSLEVTPDNHALIFYRQFGTKLNTHRAGHMAAAIKDLDSTTSQWKTGYLNNGLQSNSQISLDVETQTSSTFFINLKTTPSIETAQQLSEVPEGEIAGGKINLHDFTTGELSVQGGIVSYLPDLLIDEIVVSNPHPQRNETVLISAFVRNSGLKTVADSEVAVRFYEVTPRGRRKLIGTQQVGDLAFNEKVSVTMPLKIKKAGIDHVIIAEIIVNDPESDASNNTSQLVFGQTPPVMQLHGSSEPEQRVVALRWFQPDTQGIEEYLIFRSVTSGSGYEPIGTTKQTTFLDRLVTDGTIYHYVVVAADVYGSYSEISNEAIVRF